MRSINILSIIWAMLFSGECRHTQSHCSAQLCIKDDTCMDNTLNTLEITATHEIYRNYYAAQFIVSFRARGDGLIDVVCMSRDPEYAERNVSFSHIQKVAFYPLDPCHGPLYVMSLWFQGASRPIDHEFLHVERYDSDVDAEELHPVSPEELNPPRWTNRVRAALRFLQVKVDGSFAKNLWDTQLGWAVNREDVERENLVCSNIVQHDGRFLLANRRSAPEPGDCDISALLAAATPDDHERLRAWECAICHEKIDEGTDEGRKLVAAHDPHMTTQPDGTAQELLHVFHRHCLEEWRLTNSGCSNRCPTCKKPIHTRPLSEVWSAGTTLNARMGNPYLAAGPTTTPLHSRFCVEAAT
jgi:hypothetical protein